MKPMVVNTLKQISLVGLWIFLLTAFSNAQDYEYGKTEELKGLKTYMVDTYGEVKVRDEIIARIAKQLPDLKLVEEFTEAEITISYSPVTGDPRSPGVGVVAIEAKGRDKRRPRILMNFEPARGGSIFDKKTHIKFADEFIRAYRKANGLK